MQPGLVLDKTDCPETPDPVRQKNFLMMVQKIQYLAYWCRFHCSFTAVQLAQFCASAGPLHWAALAHLMGYLVYRPSLKLKYDRKYEKGLESLDCFEDSDWGTASRASRPLGSWRDTTDLC